MRNVQSKIILIFLMIHLSSCRDKNVEDKEVKIPSETAYEKETVKARLDTYKNHPTRTGPIYFLSSTT